MINPMNRKLKGIRMKDRVCQTVIDLKAGEVRCPCIVRNVWRRPDGKETGVYNGQAVTRPNGRADWVKVWREQI